MQTILIAVVDKSKSSHRGPSKGAKPAPASGSAAANSAATSGSTSNVEAERSVAVKAIAGELLQMVLPALLKMSSKAVGKSIQDDQVMKAPLCRPDIHTVNSSSLSTRCMQSSMACLAPNLVIRAGTKEQEPWHDMGHCTGEGESSGTGDS